VANYQCPPTVSFHSPLQLHKIAPAPAKTNLVGSNLGHQRKIPNAKSRMVESPKA